MLSGLLWRIGIKMIKVGQQKKAKYWGKFTVRKVARLKKPVECKCHDIGTEVVPEIWTGC
jgi:hypothetical protein